MTIFVSITIFPMACGTYVQPFSHFGRGLAGVGTLPISGILWMLGRAIREVPRDLCVPVVKISAAGQSSPRE